jgi:predicted ester cyclase
MRGNEEIIRELYSAADGRSLDTRKLVSMFSEDGYMLDVPSGTTFRGEAIGESIAGLASAFPDVHHKLHSVHLAENVVVVELAIQGTHRGELVASSRTIAPTGKTIDVPSCDVFKLEGGKIASFHCYNMPSAMLRQLGVDVG